MAGRVVREASLAVGGWYTVQPGIRLHIGVTIDNGESGDSLCLCTVDLRGERWDLHLWQNRPTELDWQPDGKSIEGSLVVPRITFLSIHTIGPAAAIAARLENWQ